MKNDQRNIGDQRKRCNNKYIHKYVCFVPVFTRITLFFFTEYCKKYVKKNTYIHI